MYLRVPGFVDSGCGDLDVIAVDAGYGVVDLYNPFLALFVHESIYYEADIKPHSKFYEAYENQNIKSLFEEIIFFGLNSREKRNYLCFKIDRRIERDLFSVCDDLYGLKGKSNN